MKYQKVETNLAKTLKGIDVKKAMRDDYAKCILADPQILANIVKVVMPEFKEYSIEEIIPCIGETVVTLLVPEMLCIRIESDGTEDSDIEDGKIIYDIRFPLYYNNRTVKMLVNVEAQKSTSLEKLGYNIESRITYYMARLVSSQKNIEFIHSDYDSLKDVYSIWICMDAANEEDSIIKMGLESKLIYGKSSWMPQCHIMNGVIIRIRSGKNHVESKNKLISMLELLFSATNKENKIQQLEKYGLKMTTELEGCVSDMCNISDLLVEESEERGRLEGKLEGRLEGKIEGRLEGEMKATLDNIRTLMKKLNQTEEEAMDTLDIKEEDREEYRRKLDM